VGRTRELSLLRKRLDRADGDLPRHHGVELIWGPEQIVDAWR
jgi:hypothetical protein